MRSLKRIISKFMLENRLALTYIDVGARGGIDYNWDWLGSSLAIVAFDADQSATDEIERDLIKRYHRDSRVYCACLWSTAKEMVLYHTNSPHCSSLLKPEINTLRRFPEADRFDVLSTSNVSTSRLDYFDYPSNGESSFLKVDVQGGSYHVLEGLGFLQSKLMGIQVEVSFLRTYKDEYTFGAINDKLEKMGFELIDLSSMYWREDVSKNIPGARGQIIFADALYMLPVEKLLQKVECLSVSEKIEFVIKYVAICESFGMNDRIYAVCSLLLKQLNQVNSSSGEILKKLARHSQRGAFISRCTPIKKRFLLPAFLHDLADLISSHALNWRTADNRFASRPRSKRLEFLR